MRYMLDAGVRIVDVASGSIRELNVRSLEPRVAGVKFSPDGTAIAYSAARDGDFRFVSEIFVAPVAGGIGRSLTDFNAAIAALELGKVEPLRWRGADNFEMDGVLTFPPGYQAGRPYATRIKAPTLVLCDTGDQRVPITQSFMLYHAMRDNGVKTQFIAYPVDGHAPSDPVHQRDVGRRWAAWLKEHLDGGTR